MYYVNAEVNDGSSIAKLMQYFKTAKADDLSQGKLSKHVNYLKSTKEGKAAMCEFTEKIVRRLQPEGDQADTAAVRPGAGAGGDLPRHG